MSFKTIPLLYLYHKQAEKITITMDDGYVIEFTPSVEYKYYEDAIMVVTKKKVMWVNLNHVIRIEVKLKKETKRKVMVDGSMGG